MPSPNLVVGGRKPVEKPRKEHSDATTPDTKNLPSSPAQTGGVVVVGRGYGDEPTETPPKNSLKGSRERRRSKTSKSCQQQPVSPMTFFKLFSE